VEVSIITSTQKHAEEKTERTKREGEHDKNSLIQTTDASHTLK